MLDGRLEEPLAFNAPFVIDRLVRDRVTDTPELAEEIFTEAKRYLVLCEAIPDVSFGMFSALVDEALILVALVYAQFRASYPAHRLVVPVGVTAGTIRRSVGCSAGSLHTTSQLAHLRSTMRWRRNV